MAIVCAFNMWAVQRHISKLPKKFETAKVFLENLMRPMYNYGNYRLHLKNIKGDVLPYLGVFLRDVTFIEDGNKNYAKEGVINIDKLLLLGGQLNQFTKYQKSDYEKHLENKNEELIFTWYHLEYLTEQKLEKLSIKMEPLPSFEEDDCQDECEIELDTTL